MTRLILIAALALLTLTEFASAQTQAKHKAPLPANACSTMPNRESIWYPEDSQYSPPGYPDGARMRFNDAPVICSKRKWVPDEETIKWDRERRKPLDDLLQAARSRLLTIEETKQLLDYGLSIFTHEGQTYNQVDIDRQFDNLLFLQKRFMVEAVKAK